MLAEHGCLHDKKTSFFLIISEDSIGVNFLKYFFFSGHGLNC